MKKNLTIIILVIVVLISFFIIYKDWKSKHEPKQGEIEQVTKREDLVMADSFQTKVSNPKDAYVKFDVKYPYFKNADASFNAGIEKLVTDSMADHSQTSKENWQARYDTQVKGENIPKVPAKDDDKFSFFSDFTIEQSNSNYISFVLKDGGFSGGAHEYENITSFNYDVKNKKVIKLSDIFPNDPQYLIHLGTQSRDILTKRFITDNKDENSGTPEAIKEYTDNITGMLNTGTEPTEENFSIFTFTPDKVKIYFAEYQVGPYVFGIPEVEISRK